MPSTSPRLHIVGASGSGTTTLGAALARKLGCRHLDTDGYFWELTDPPFTTKRPVDKRLELMEADLDSADAWVLTGSLTGWGDVLIPRFTLAVFLHLPADVRMVRLQARERERYGTDIDPGGKMHQIHIDFIAWAAGYDDPAFAGRSLVEHRAWLGRLPCPVLEIGGAPTLNESLARVLAAL